VSAPSLPEKVLALHRALARARIAHAFGGALALAYYAEPRATIDIDLNVFLAPSAVGRVMRALTALGLSGDVDAERISRDGQCRLWWADTPVDLFFAYDELHEAMRSSLRRQPFAGKRIPVLAPEHLMVCKALFDRPKDWLDIEQMLIGVDALDLHEVTRWLQRLLATGDARSRRLLRLAAKLGIAVSREARP
jgi:hypothetical protein